MSLSGSNDTLTPSLSWNPPPLEALNFSTNCVAVGDFYQAWFTPFNDGTPYNWTLNFTFHVASSLPADVVQPYFRSALPAGINPVPTYGQILEWEQHLRINYSATALGVGRLGTNASILTTHFPYFDLVIEKPGQACWQEACTHGFTWDTLGDINGPGVSVNTFTIPSIC